MIVKDFFEKDINRNIETVIKADDKIHISTEVEEYVVTKEVAEKIRGLFSSYKDYSGVANGVWISGFYGSGKSHLLKIISYVLENKEFDGRKIGELFAEKIEDDKMLKADIISATRILAESILFNIDQQAQITSKADANAILSVFYKVFYDHLGFYGFQPHVAEFEMWLDKQDKYETFKSRFGLKYSKEWTDARPDYSYLKTDVAEVFSDLFGGNSSKYEDMLDSIEKNHKQSIEDFCRRVNDYIKTKAKGFRLNFFVDEVGQYIGNDTKLMLNLQTIAETLATKTGGNSWIFVTSQEDMEAVVGDMTKNQKHDFSRIQARFKIKISLTSKNVDEVIEKRLLKKNKEAQSHLISIYKKESNLLKTLFSFSDSGVQFKEYRDETDFAGKMPFVAYQFDLCQQCIKALSKHDAFMGEHASVGERGMLGVFQHVTQKIQEREENATASFDLMFDGMRGELKGEIQSSIILAEKNLADEFAKKVLKALFLVKYFGQFKTTKRNISVLMIDRIDIDLKKHQENIDRALNLLENQIYVRRNGDIYEFLTDDEKDVEEEIKNTNVDDQAVTQLLKEILFDEIIRENKIKYPENKQDYEFTSKIDGSILGREKELEIEIITENFYDYGNTAFLQSDTSGRAGMRLVLPSNATFMKDLKMYLKTDKYNKQNQSTSNKSEVKRILQEKVMQNTERRRDLVTTANNLLASASVYLNSGKLEMNQTTDGKTLVVNAFQSLIKTVYTNLRMLGSVPFNEETFKQVINGKTDDLFRTDDETMSEAESEILNFINKRKNESDRTSLNDLKTFFAKRPYGWYQNGVWTIVANLYKRGKIEIKRDSNVLNNSEVIQALLNSANYNNTLLEPQAVFDPKLVRDLKEVYADLFDENCSSTEAKDVTKDFKDKLKEMNYKLNNEFLSRKDDFHFISSLTDFRDKVRKLCDKEESYFLNNLKDFEDELLDAKQNVFDPIRSFINGEQFKIYEEIRNFIKGDTSNFDHIEGNELNILKALLDNPKPYIGNYIKEAKMAKDELTRKVSEKIEKEKTESISVLESKRQDIKSKEEFVKLDAAEQNKLIAPFDEEIEKVKTQRYIGNIKTVRSNLVENLYPKQLNKMIQLSTPVETDSGEVNEPAPQYIRGMSIKYNFAKTELETEDDVIEYVEAMKKALLEQIRKSKRILL